MSLSHRFLFPVVIQGFNCDTNMPTQKFIANSTQNWRDKNRNVPSSCDVTTVTRLFELSWLTSQRLTIPEWRDGVILYLTPDVIGFAAQTFISWKSYGKKIKLKRRLPTGHKQKSAISLTLQSYFVGTQILDYSVTFLYGQFLVNGITSRLLTSVFPWQES